MKHEKETPKVRLCAYPADWLLKDGFASSKEITWSTGQNTKPDDIQVFAISSTLGHARSLENDRRRDSVHSIWIATTPPDPEYAEEKWPVQAEFTLLVKLQNPVPKLDLVRAGLLKEHWPRHWQGKIFHDERDVRKLGEVLARKNPRQRRMIFDALNL
jgi:hypothetical protein